MQDREKKRESKRSCLFFSLERLPSVFINMSGHPVYAVVNYHQKHRSGTTNLETTDDEATYTNVHISLSGRSAQQKGGSDSDIYSKVSLPNQENSQHTSASLPDDCTPRTTSEGKFQWRDVLRPIVLMLILTVLLLIVIFILSAFYASSENSHRERMRALEKFSTESWQLAVRLQKELSEINNTLLQSQSALRNYSEEKMSLLHQLNNSQMMTTELQRNNTALSRDKAAIQSELELLKMEATRECAPDWQYISGKCYFFSTEEKKWAESCHACVTMGGHLVIIESKEEWNHIQTIIQRHWKAYWIGLRYDTAEKQWHWMDYTKPKYWPMTHGYIDTWIHDTQQKKHCVKTYATWMTTNCDIKARHICESKARLPG